MGAMGTGRLRVQLGGPTVMVRPHAQSRRLQLTVPMLAGCAPLPGHMNVVYASLDALPVTVNDDEDVDSETDTVVKDVRRKAKPACAAADQEVIADLWASDSPTGSAGAADPFGALLSKCALLTCQSAR